MDKIIDLSDPSLEWRPYQPQPYHPPISYFTYEDILDALHSMCTPIEYKANLLNRIEFISAEDRLHLNEKAEKFLPKEYYLKFTDGRWAYRLIGSNIQIVNGRLQRRNKL